MGAGKTIHMKQLSYKLNIINVSCKQQKITPELIERGEACDQQSL